MSRDVEALNRQLLTCVSNGDCKGIEENIKLGANVSWFDENGDTPLGRAVKQRVSPASEKIVECLLNCKAEVNLYMCKCSSDYHWCGPPLCHAAERGYLNIVQILLKAGAEVNRKNGRGYTPLACAVEWDRTCVVQYLLSKKAEVDELSLEFATRKNNMDIIKCLWNNSSNISTLEFFLKHGALKGNSALVKFFLTQGTRVKISESCIDYLVEAANIDTIKLIVENTSNTFDFLISAILHCKLDLVQYLLSQGAEVNATDANGNTPLAIAMKTKHTSEIIKYLVKSGAALCQVGENGQTLFISAILNNKLDLVQHFLSQGAEVNATDSKGNTPLAIAMNTQNTEMIKYLVKSGADVCQVGENGQTPFISAILNNKLDLVQYFLSQGAKVNTIDSNGNTILANAVKTQNRKMIEYLVKFGADVCKVGKNGKTPLAIATEKGDIDLIKFLLANKAERSLQSAFVIAIQTGNLAVVDVLKGSGADINFTYRNGETPLIKAINCGQLKVAKYLVDNGASTNLNFNIIGDDGYTPLTKFVAAENMEMVKFLVEMKADVNFADGNEKVALQIAASNYYFEIVVYLLEAGADVELAKTEIEDYRNWNDDFNFYFEQFQKKSKLEISGTGHEEAI